MDLIITINALNNVKAWPSINQQNQQRCGVLDFHSDQYFLHLKVFWASGMWRQLVAAFSIRKLFAFSFRESKDLKPLIFCINFFEALSLAFFHRFNELSRNEGGSVTRLGDFQSS